MKTYIFIWKIRRSDIWRALLHMGLDRSSLRQNSAISFFKLLGTGSGERFTPRDADSQTWAILVTSKASVDELHAMKPFTSWRKFACSEESYTLMPISSHGAWGGIEPFHNDQPLSWKGEIAAITRAKIKWHLNLQFWRATPTVTKALHNSPGLIRAIGIGEAPIGLQGTFSHWRSSEDLRAFAYRGEAHQRAIALTSELNWYSEELFARFAVIDYQSSTLNS
jgi:hypothetical protein